MNDDSKIVTFLIYEGFEVIVQHNWEMFVEIMFMFYCKAVDCLLFVHFDNDNDYGTAK